MQTVARFTGSPRALTNDEGVIDGARAASESNEAAATCARYFEEKSIMKVVVVLKDELGWDDGQSLFVVEGLGRVGEQCKV